MRFKKLTVHSEGPVSGLTVDFGGVNLIVGDNEEGKTTLTDILVRKLLEDTAGDGKRGRGIARGAKQLLRAGRFEPDKPEEFVCEGENFDERRREFLRLLIVREGDNRVTGRGDENPDDAAFWNSDVKDMIYGKDGIFAKLSTDFKKTLGVSTSASWMNQFLDRIESARSVVENQTQNVERIKTGREQTARFGAQIGEIGARLETLEQSRSQNEEAVKLRAAKRYFETKDLRRSVLEELEPLRRTDWKTAAREWSDVRQKLQQTERDIDKGKDRLEAVETRLAEIGRERVKAAGTAERKRTAVDALAEDRREIGVRAESKTGLAMWVLIALVGALAAAAGVLGLVKLLPFPLWVCLVLVVPGGLGFLAGFVGLVLRIAASPTFDDEAVKQMRKYQRAAGSVETVRALETNIALLEKDLVDLESLIDELASEEEELTGGAAKLRETLRSLSAEQSELARLDAEFCRKYADYDNAVKKQAQLEEKENALTSAENALRSSGDEVRRLFGDIGDTRLSEEISRLEKKLAGTEDADSEFDEEEFRTLRGQSNELENTIKRITGESKELRGRVEVEIGNAMKNLASANELAKKFYPEIERLGLMDDVFNIYGLRAELDRLAVQVGKDAEASAAVADAFDRASSRIEELLDATLGKDLFRHALLRLTAGNYNGVEYRIDEQKVDISLTRADGTSYRLRDLSTGARNQFALAMRFALAAEEFDPEDGILILDDAFLTFDEKRRKSSVEFLKELAGKGWQIVYSTVNDGAMESVFDEVFGKGLNKIALREKQS